MNMETKLSAKGQIVIPKDVRERMRLEIGEKFDVVERENEVVLRRKNGKRATPAEQAVADAVKRLQKIIKYEGPPISIDEMDRLTKDAISRHYRRAYDQE